MEYLEFYDEQRFRNRCSVCGCIEDSWEHQLNRNVDHAFIKTCIKEDLAKFPKRKKCSCFACTIEREIAFCESSMLKYENQIALREGLISTDPQHAAIHVQWRNSYQRSLEFHAERMKWLQTL